MDLSIIIPVYNTEPELLKKCLKSIIKFKNNNYEILIIDDGSNTENSSKYTSIIQQFKNVSIRYIKKTNGGVSSARNLGINQASGKYIMFVDSDDTINTDAISNNDLKMNYDIIFYNRVYIKNQNVIEDKSDDLKNGEVNYLLIMEKLLKSKNFFYGPVSKLYKLDYLKTNKVLFDETIIHGEDMIFNLDLLIKKPKMYYIDKNLYNYYYSPSNSLNRWKKKTDVMFENKKYLYKRKIETINMFSFKNKKEIESYCNKNYIDSSFSICVKLYNDTVINKEILEKTRKNIEDINIKNTNLNIITKIKYQLINKKVKMVFILLSLIKK